MLFYFTGDNNREQENQWRNRRNANRLASGLQEQFEWYDKCKNRERNKGLWNL